MRSLGRKTISVLMSIVLVVGLMPLPAYAKAGALGDGASGASVPASADTLADDSSEGGAVSVQDSSDDPVDDGTNIAYAILDLKQDLALGGDPNPVNSFTLGDKQLVKDQDYTIEVTNVYTSEVVSTKDWPTAAGRYEVVFTGINIYKGTYPSLGAHGSLTYDIHDTANEPYGILYGDGELVIQKGNTPEAGRTVATGAEGDALIKGNLGNYWGLATWTSDEAQSIKRVTVKDTIKPEGMNTWFYNLSNLEYADISKVDTSQLPGADWDMDGLFTGCTKLTTLVLGANFTFSKRALSDPVFNKEPEGASPWTGPQGQQYTSAELVANYNGATMAGTWTRTIDASVTTDPTEYESYAILYNNGDFVFQNSAECDGADGHAEADVVKKYDANGAHEYKEIRTLDYTGFMSYPAWYENRGKIKSVSFNGTVKISNVAGMFNDCGNLEKVDLTGLDMSEATGMDFMFAWCFSLKELDLSMLDTSKVVTMSNALLNCSALTSVNLTGLSTSANYYLTNFMAGCSSLETVSFADFDTTNVVDFSNMFVSCSSLKNVDISSFNMQSVQFDEATQSYKGGLFLGPVSNLETLTLGRDSLKNMQNLPVGHWSLEGGSQSFETTEEFLAGYDGQTMAGTWTRTKYNIKVTKPEATNFAYDGETHSGVEPNDGYYVSGTTSTDQIGTYVVTVTLDYGYEWEDGSTDALELTWSIYDGDDPSGDDYRFDITGYTVVSDNLQKSTSAKSLAIDFLEIGDIESGWSMTMYTKYPWEPGNFRDYDIVKIIGPDGNEVSIDAQGPFAAGDYTYTIEGNNANKGSLTFTVEVKDGIDLSDGQIWPAYDQEYVTYDGNVKTINVPDTLSFYWNADDDFHELKRGVDYEVRIIADPYDKSSTVVNPIEVGLYRVQICGINNAFSSAKLKDYEICSQTDISPSVVDHRVVVYTDDADLNPVRSVTLNGTKLERNNQYVLYFWPAAKGAWWDRTETTPTEPGIYSVLLIGPGGQPGLSNASDSEWTGSIQFDYEVRDASKNWTEVHAVVNEKTGARHYTVNSDEIANLVQDGWNDLGIAWTTLKESAQPVYAIQDSSNGEWHYTYSKQEIEYLQNLGWENCGIAWFISTGDDKVPVYRVYNPNVSIGSHLYTTSETERDTLIKLGWYDEGIGFYVDAAGTAEQVDVARTVTFDSQGGSSVEAAEVLYGEKVTRPADPTREGFDFDGWKLDGEPFDFNAAVTANITLVAAWTQVDKSELEKAVAIAKTSLDGVAESADGEDVYVDKEWVTPAKKQALDDAIAAAEQVLADRAATQAQVGASLEALQQAIDDLGITKGKKPLPVSVTFKNYDGQVLSTAKYDIGTAAGDIVVPADPEKPEDAGYTYRFAGWEPELASVTEEATYTAAYTPVPKKFTITFKNGDDVISATDYDYGTPAGDIALPADPQKPQDVRYTYAFKEWSPAVAQVTEDATYEATFTPTLRKYTVTFLNDDGAQLASEQLDYGTTADAVAAKAPAATKESDNPDQYRYAFGGWDKVFAPVEGDVTYTATFKTIKQTYMVTFLTPQGNRISRAQYDYDTPGSKVVKPSSDLPELKKPDANGYSYQFAGWRELGDAGVLLTDATKITKAVMYEPAYNEVAIEYSISYANEQGVANANTASYKASDTGLVVLADLANREGYVFDGWYEEGDVTERDGDYVAKQGALPVQVILADSAHDYKLVAVWSEDLQGPTVEMKTVVFNANGGSAVDAQTVQKGAVATEPAAPSRSGYEFKGWQTAQGTAFDFSTAVDANITLIAKWQPKQYEIKYVINAAYGTWAASAESSAPHYYTIEDEKTLPGAEAVSLISDGSANYVFAGWYDNAEFKGDRITSIPKGSKDDVTLYLRAIDTLSTAEKKNDADAGTGVTAASDESFKTDTADKAKGREIVLEVEKGESVADERSAAAKEQATKSLKDDFASQVAQNDKNAIGNNTPVVKYSVELELQEPTGETVRTLTEPDQVKSLTLRLPVGRAYAGRDAKVLQIHTNLADGTPQTLSHNAGKVDSQGFIQLTVDRLSDFYVTVTKATVQPQPQSFTYDGKEHVSITDDEGYTIVSGTWKATKVGTYYVTVRPREGYMWADTTTTDKTLSWSIRAANAPAPTVTIYRLYNRYSGEHLYTNSASEKSYLARIGWKDEGIAWIAPASGSAVYRMYNPNNGDHHYTTSASEKNFLSGIGWRYEGVSWRSAPASGKPLYRLFNPYLQAGSHHYTTSASERAFLKSIGWRDEGVGWYST